MSGDQWTVERHLEGKPPETVSLFHFFCELLERCGPYTFSVSKTTITFKGSRRGFAGARPTQRGLAVYLDLQRAIEDPRVTRASPYTKRLFVHHLLIGDRSQMDDEFASWLAEAYSVGQGAHLG
jgi:Domain of unknown function (DUF5655)